MRRPLPVAAIGGLMGAVLPRDLGDPAVGDLYEEFGLRAAATSRPRATAWFAAQAAGSVPRLLWLSARRLSSVLSLAVAAASFFVLGLIEPYMHRALAAVVSPPLVWQLIVDLLVGFAACACGGFVATSLRRGSAAIYSLIGTAYIVSGLPGMNPELPLWFPAAFVVVALVAPVTGGAAFIAISQRWSRRRNVKRGESP